MSSPNSIEAARHCTGSAVKDLRLGFSDGRRATPAALIPGAMVPLWHPLRFLLVALAGWINQQQRDVIDNLQEENCVLREQLGPRRLRFADDQRIRLAAKAKTLGRRALAEIGSIGTPGTLLAG
jgi:hypothetical protein